MKQEEVEEEEEGGRRDVEEENGTMEALGRTETTKYAP